MYPTTATTYPPPHKYQTKKINKKLIFENWKLSMQCTFLAAEHNFDIVIRLID